MLFIKSNSKKSHILLYIVIFCNLDILHSQKLFESNSGYQENASSKNDLSFTNSNNNRNKFLFKIEN